jgi:hypothetical protein
LYNIKSDLYKNKTTENHFFIEIFKEQTI